ncbi:hypothetical protein CORC01_06816 [Colletotrichum orchidophilum]|uniref:CBM1 domain-containing protein n=1 Tax=Colletotrichum orchidophilum TaxID=1209926 RepID=A0A1G4B9B0_9PEZI|nr:uncharacterized protein CORC01_06816 [Colletotrichum orchidophilum]OHE97953.1 hypothetical protein CORC01_06816 [Colletotrichum orchidophilum]
MHLISILTTALLASNPVLAQLPSLRSSSSAASLATQFTTATAPTTQPPFPPSPRAATVTITVSSWITQIVTVTDIDTIIETITVWVPPPPPSTTSSIRSTTSSSAASSRGTFTTAPPALEPTQTKYGQCGGSSYVGATKCAAGSSCSVLNPWYYQCL